ncbi:hypothetical protein BHUM_03132 [Candidatus Burkholderia humilis]|nr:hypothetical protein BHUM_03132 [Candidatus Burkholderia humilis]
MPSIKPELKTRVTTDEKRQFHAAAQANGLTDSRLLEKLVQAFLKREPIASPTPASQVGVRSQQAHARLTPAEHADLGQLAAERGMSRGTYLGELFRVHAYEQPRFSTVEIDALHRAAEQLTAVGRNVNQIARALNTSLDEAHRATAIDFQHLKRMIDEQRTHVNELVRSNMRS